MTTKLTFHKLLFLLLLALLTTCGMVTPASTPTKVDATAIYSQAAATVQTQLTEIAASQPTATPIPPTATLEPSPTELPLVTVDGLRMAYIIDGNLYVQDSGEQPVQLTYSGQDHAPVFSDDGQKILFYRGETRVEHLINADGSQEQRLVPPGMLAKLNLGYKEITKIANIVFLSDTHHLLFNTMNTQMNWDLLILDTDTAKIKQLLPPGKGGIFQISPDGRLDVDYAGDFIDLVDIYEPSNRRHMITYQPHWNYSMRNPFWSRDSSKCIFVVPIGGSGDGTDGLRPDTIWQYSVDSNSAIEIRLNPPPIDDNYALSPDGNWIAYTYNSIPGKTDETTPSGVYIGNLRNGSSHLAKESRRLGGTPYSYHWSPDNEHFIFQDLLNINLYLGDVWGNITPIISQPEFSGMGDIEFIGWVDSHRYLYKKDRKDRMIMGEVGKEGSVPVIALPTELEYLHPGNFTYVFIKPK